MADETEKWEPLKIETPPLFVWPPRPTSLVKYIFGYPGYFLPRNICYMVLALFTWFFLTPALNEMKTFQLDWIAFIYGRNLILMLLIFGGWHLRFHTIKAQGRKYSFNTSWPNEKHRRFLFNNQVHDNMFYSIL